MWDERYSAEEYAYGTTPNEFLVEKVNCIPKGKVLSLAEGEGRNAVFLAKQGYAVTAVDASLVGLNKARKLAEENDVVVEFIHADLADAGIRVGRKRVARLMRCAGLRGRAPRLFLPSLASPSAPLSFDANRTA